MSMDALFADLEQARNSWAELYDLFVRGKYDLAGARPILNGQSVETLHRRAAVILDGLAALRPSDTQSAQAMLLFAKASEVRPSLQSLNTHTQSVVTSIRPHWQDGQTLRDTNGNFSMQLVQSDGGVVTNMDTSGSFSQIDSALNQLTTHLSLLLPLCKADGIADLSQRTIALAEVTREILVMREQIRDAAQYATSSASNAAERDKAAQARFDQVEAVLTKVQTIQQQATTDVGSVAALVEQVKTIGASAGSLEKQTAAYQSSFDAFQKQLDDRNAEFVQFQENDKAAVVANKEREEEIDRLTKLADAMISGATTAGLGKSMEDTLARYERRMNSARNGFYFAVFVLILSAIPLAAYLLPGLVGTWIPALDTKAEGSPYAVLGKIVLLLPATWLTAFFTKSYAEFFSLEREYAHKAALAMSVDGFKRQAPTYQEEITAEVFLEIRNNPGRGQNVEPAAHPLYDVLAKVVGKVLDKGKDEKKP